jgi:hypothetical protein
VACETIPQRATRAVGLGFRIPRLWRSGPCNGTGAIAIVLSSDSEGGREHFKTVDSVDRTYHPDSQRDEHFEIFLCRGPYQNLQTPSLNIKNCR